VLTLEKSISVTSVLMISIIIASMMTSIIITSMLSPTIVTTIVDRGSVDRTQTQCINLSLTWQVNKFCIVVNR
jgi:hypothetical protein